MTGVKSYVLNCLTSLERSGPRKPHHELQSLPVMFFVSLGAKNKTWNSGLSYSFRLIIPRGWIPAVISLGNLALKSSIKWQCVIIRYRPPVSRKHVILMWSTINLDQSGKLGAVILYRFFKNKFIIDFLNSISKLKKYLPSYHSHKTLSVGLEYLTDYLELRQSTW